MRTNSILRWAALLACLVAMGAWVQAEDQELGNIEDDLAQAADEEAAHAEAAVAEVTNEEAPAEVGHAEPVDQTAPAHEEPAHVEDAHGHDAPAVADHGDAGHGTEAAHEGEHAEGAHHGPKWLELTAAVINFAIFIFLLVKFGKAPLNSYLTGKRESYLQAVKDAQALMDRAEAKHKEYSRKLANIQQEADEVIKRAEQEAIRRKEAIIEGAQSAAKKMEADAKMTMESELFKAQEEIRTLLAEVVVENAEKLITDNLNDEDQKRLNEEFLKKLEGAS